MATNNTDDSAILGILKNESESEREGSAETSVERLDEDSVEKKANDKYNMMEVPTARAVAEIKAKLAGQVNTAETHAVLGLAVQGDSHPEHRTFGEVGMPLAGAFHDYDADRTDTRTVRTPHKDEPEIKKANDERQKIINAINKANEKENK